MHNAPWVQYPVGRFSWALWGSVLLGVFCVLLTGALFYLDRLKLSAALLSWTLVLLSAMLWRANRRPSQAAWLLWDGQGWQWCQDQAGHDAIVVDRVSVQADFQHWMLLHLHSEGAADRAKFSEWVWLYKGFAPGQWHGLRCAVYSRLKT